MREQANRDLRLYLAQHGVKQHELASALGYTASHFCVLLRKELTEDRKAECRRLIDQISIELYGSP